MKVALFARYSSKMQDELSIEAQLHEMEAFASRQGWEVAVRYLLPETRSCEVEDAPEFQDMLRDAKAKRFQVLLVHKLDRFGRNRDTAVVHKAFLRKMGIQVRSVVENLGDSVMDRAMEGMLEVMAEFYSGNLGAETRKGHRALVRKGYWTGGKPPWGFRTEPTLDGHKRLVPDPRTAPVILEVFRKTADGEAPGDVLRYVEERTGQRWTHLALYARLRNPVYYGQLEYGRTTMPQNRPRRRLDPSELTTGECEGIVPRDVWDRVQGVMDGRSRGKGVRRTRAVYLLSEMASCSACGRPLVGGLHDGTRRYYCSGRRLSERCGQPSTRADDLEQLVLEVAGRKIRDCVDVEAALADYRASLMPELGSAKAREKRLRRRLTEVRQKATNLIQAIANGLVDPGISKMLSDLRAEEGDLAEAIATCQIDAELVVDLNVAVVREHFATVGERLAEGDPADLKELLKTYFELSWDAKSKRGQLLFRLTPLSQADPIGRGKDMVGVRRPRLHLGPVVVWDLAA